MARRDRLAILRILEELRQDEVKQTGLALAEVNKEAAMLDQHARDLEAKSLSEARTSNEETRPFLAAYLDAVTKTQSRLADQRALTHERAEEIRTRLQEQFRTAKVVSVARERMEAIEAEEARNEESKDLDEAGRIGHLLRLR